MAMWAKKCKDCGAVYYDPKHVCEPSVLASFEAGAEFESVGQRARWLPFDSWVDTAQGRFELWYASRRLT